MVTVAPADVVRKINKVKTDRLYGGVPKQAFTELEVALDWLLPLVAEGVVGLDGHALKVRLLQQIASAGRF